MSVEDSRYQVSEFDSLGARQISFLQAWIEKKLRRYVSNEASQYTVWDNLMHHLTANVKEFMLEHVVGPEAIDALINKIFKAIESILQNTHHPWSITLEPNSFTRIRAKRTHVLKVTQMVLIPSPDAKENDPTQVFYEIEGQRILIASLRSEKSRAVSLPLFLAPGNWQAIQVRGYTCKASMKSLHSVAKRDLEKIQQCETPEQYAKCTFDWVNGRLYKTDINEEPISKDLVPHADKLQELCRRGFIPLQVFLSVESKSVRQKDAIIGFMPKEWATDVGKQLRKGCFYHACTESQDINVLFSKKDLDEDGSFLYLESALTAQQFVDLGVPAQLAITLAQKGDLHGLGGFTPEDEEEIQKGFHESLYRSKKLEDALVKEMVFTRIALKKVTKKQGLLLDLLLNALREYELDKNWNFK